MHVFPPLPGLLSRSSPRNISLPVTSAALVGAALLQIGLGGALGLGLAGAPRNTPPLSSTASGQPADACWCKKAAMWRVTAGSLA